MDRLTVGQMARINNVSEQTLRLYDRMGLLSPQCVGNANGYRYYTITQSARLDMIQHMKSMGMSLKQIKEQLDTQDVSVIERLLSMQLENLSTQIEELTRTRKAVERSLTNYQRYHASPRDGTILTEFIPKRKIYRYDSGINFYDYDMETYESILRELKKHILLNRLPMAYFCNAGTLWRQELLDKREFISTEMFIFVDDDFDAGTATEIISAGTYLCIYCDSFHKEKEYAHRLLDHARDQGYSIAGDYICEVIAELPVFVNNERGMFIKMQVPIKF